MSATEGRDGGRPEAGSRATTSFGELAIGGAPTPAEVAAIVAAIEVVWPKPRPPRRPAAPSTAWRYSGRWWSEGRLPSRW